MKRFELKPNFEKKNKLAAVYICISQKNENFLCAIDTEMLKVVGASWAQTQLSWCLIITITMLGLLAFYFGGTIRYRIKRILKFFTLSL